MAYLKNSTWGNFVLGTDYTDIIENNNESVTVDGRAGNDGISNAGASLTEDYLTTSSYRFPDNSSINGGMGDDSIVNGSSRSTLIGGDGNDTITNWSSAIFVYRNRTIFPISNDVSIDGGSGNDSIHNAYNFNVSINGGTGNDKISNEGYYVQIIGGEGKDTIENKALTAAIFGDAGND